MRLIRVSLNIAKGTTDPRVEFILQTWIKFQVQNLDKVVSSKSQPNISMLKHKILTKPSFRILTKIPTSYLQPNISSKILTKLQFQNLA